MTAYIKLLRRQGLLSTCLYSSSQVKLSGSADDCHDGTTSGYVNHMQSDGHNIPLHSTVLSTRAREYLLSHRTAATTTTEVGSSVTPDATIWMSLSPLELACLTGNTQAITLLFTLCPEECLDALIHSFPQQLDNTTNSVFTTLHLAVLSGRLSAVSRLLRLVYQLQRESEEIQRFKTNKKLTLLSDADSSVYTILPSERRYTIDTVYSDNEEEGVVSHTDAKALFLSDNNNLINTQLKEEMGLKGHNYDSLGEAVTTSSDDRSDTRVYTWCEVMPRVLTARDSRGLTALELAVYLDRVSIALSIYVIYVYTIY